MEAHEKEPVFARQEQSVVYLFSRYWHRIKHFEYKRITDIQAGFPDCSLEDWLEAIEFEYNLDSFYNHVNRDSLSQIAEYNTLYIVYWEEDADRKELSCEIRKKGYVGKVVFVCLCDYFRPLVEEGPNCLATSWVFSPNKTKDYREVYPFNSIRDSTYELIRNGIVEPLTVQTDLYRVAGFNKENAGYIELDHWKRIHFYTTGGLHKNQVPSRLFLKPTGCKRFTGYFNVKYAFIVKKGGKLMKDYYRKYYFYEFETDERVGKSSERLSLVYSDFVMPNHDRGIELYDYLRAEKYALKQASELIRRENMRHVEKIVG